MFGRATITLGIGPHSSLQLFLLSSLLLLLLKHDTLLMHNQWCQNTDGKNLQIQTNLRDLHVLLCTTTSHKIRFISEKKKKYTNIQSKQGAHNSS